MPDQPPQGRLVHDFADRNCGNGVLLRHGDGWETQYCHLRQGSVRVAAGDRVEAGQPLGLVGMSGEANFPHVHLSVRRDGRRHRPIHRRRRRRPLRRAGHAALVRTAARTGWPMSRCRSRSSGSPTTSPIATRSSPARPALPSLASSSPALVGYVLAYGLRPGDRLEIAILGPDGAQVSAAGFDLDAGSATRHPRRRQARASRRAGRREPTGSRPGCCAASAASPAPPSSRSLSRAGRRSGPAARPPPAPPRRRHRESPAPAPRTPILAICRGGKLTTAAT